MKEKKPENGLRSERPIDSSQQDLLDRCWFSRVVKDLAMQSELPVALAVLGEWGTGKTSILRLIREIVPKKAVCLYYNAWKNECGESSGHGLLRFLLAELAQDAEEKAQVPVLLEEFGERDAIGIGRFEELLSGHITKALKKRRAERVVLLLDDLDRCRPQALVSLLETLALYILASDIPVAVIATLDESRAAQAYAKALDLEGGEDEGQAYFTRVFSLMLSVPPVDAAGWRAMIEERFPALRTEMAKDDRELLCNAIGLSVRTVRELKHRLNEVAFWALVAKGNARAKVLSFEALLRWYFMTALDKTLWADLSAGEDELKWKLDSSRMLPGVDEDGAAITARSESLAALMSDAILEPRNLRGIEILGKQLGLPLRPRIARAPQKDKFEATSWSEFKILANTAESDSDLVSIVRRAAVKAIEDMSDCIACSNIAIECENRSVDHLAEILYVKALDALDGVDDPRPNEGTASIVTSYITFLASKGRVDEARKLLGRIDHERADLSPVALLRLIDFAGTIRDKELRETAFGNLMKAEDLRPDWFGSALREYLSQRDTQPKNVVPHIEAQRAAHKDDGLWQWACAEAFACVMARSDKPDQFEAQFLACSERALQMEDVVPTTGLVQNAIVRLAALRLDEAVDVMERMHERKALDPRLVMSLAQSDGAVAQDSRFKKIVQAVLPALQR